MCSEIITLTITQSRRHWHMIVLSIKAQLPKRRGFEKDSRKLCDTFEKQTFQTLKE
jgi:hypothetical protein